MGSELRKPILGGIFMASLNTVPWAVQRIWPDMMPDIVPPLVLAASLIALPVTGYFWLKAHKSNTTSSLPTTINIINVFPAGLRAVGEAIDRKAPLIQTETKPEARIGIERGKSISAETSPNAIIGTDARHADGTPILQDDNPSE
jgi:hypothetical protein